MQTNTQDKKCWYFVLFWTQLSIASAQEAIYLFGTYRIQTLPSIRMLFHVFHHIWQASLSLILYISVGNTCFSYMFLLVGVNRAVDVNKQPYMRRPQWHCINSKPLLSPCCRHVFPRPDCISRPCGALFGWRRRGLSARHLRRCHRRRNYAHSCLLPLWQDLRLPAWGGAALLSCFSFKQVIMLHESKF